jgi:uncharacterized membrane protein
MEIKVNIINLVIYFILITWALLIVIVPYGVEPNSIHFGDEGYTSFTEHSDEIESNISDDFVKSIYDSGDSMCHQKETRTLLVNGNQMPYCSRCTALFWGLALGVAIVVFIRVELKLWWLIGGLVPMGVDGGLQLITNYESNNLFRIITGGLAGVVTGLAIGVIVFEVAEIIAYERERKKQIRAENQVNNNNYRIELELKKGLGKHGRKKNN